MSRDRRVSACGALGVGQNLVSAAVASPLRAALSIPGDKSVSHRALMFSALADGTSRIRGMLEGEDCLATRSALEAMGVPIDRDADGVYTVHGVGLHGLKAPAGPLDMGNAGTGMRLFCGLLAGQQFSSTLIGDESLSKRPMRRVTEPLAKMGANASTVDGHAPICVEPAENGLRGIEFEMPVASAQVKSALLIAGLYAGSSVTVIEPAVSRDHTERMLSAMGASVVVDGSRIEIKPAERLQAVDIDVPADLSSAAFFLVAGSIVPGSALTLPGVGINPTRDGVLGILEQMGAEVTTANERLCGGEPVADLEVRAAPLRAVQISAEWVPLAIDEFPVLFVAAACAEGTSRFEGLAELRHKESDRLAAMASGLAALGISIEEGEDWIEITGGRFGGGEIDSLDDHRIAMAFAVAGAVATGPVTILRPENIATSFPDFYALAESAGLRLSRADV